MAGHSTLGRNGYEARRDAAAIAALSGSKLCLSSDGYAMNSSRPDVRPGGQQWVARGQVAGDALAAIRSGHRQCL